MAERATPGTARVATGSSLRDSARMREQLSRLAPFAILSAFTTFCLTLAYRLNIWQDEAYSLHTSGSGIARALQQGITFEAQAPLYFVVLAAWRILNASVFHARLLSLGCGIVAIYMGWLFARRYLRTINPTLVLAALAFNPFMVWASVEIRPYCAAVMFSAVLLYLFFRGFVDDEPSVVARVGYVLLAIAGTYTQYYVALLLPAAGFILVVLRKWKVLPVYVAAMLPVAVALVPIVFVLPEQFRAYHAFALVFKPPVYAMATALLEYALPHNWIESWAHSLAKNAIYGLVGAIPAVIAFGSLRRLSRTTQALLAINGALFAIFTAAIVLAHVDLLIPRHTLIMLVPVMLLTFALIGDVLPRRRLTVVSAYLAIFAIFAFLSFYHDYRTMAKIGDWNRVARFVRANATTSDLVAVFNAEAELPFRYYFHGDNVVRAIPQSMSFDRFDEDAFVLRDEKAAASSFGEIAHGYRRIWLIESSVCSIRGDFFGCRHLESYTRTHFRTVRVVHFSGSSVTELEARDEAALPYVNGKS